MTFGKFVPPFIDLWDTDNRIYVIVLWTREVACPNHTVRALIVGELKFRFPVWFIHATVLIWRSFNHISLLIELRLPPRLTT